MAGASDYIRDNWEKLKLLGYFIGILILAVPLADILGTAWERAHLSVSILRLWLLTGFPEQAIAVILFGLFLGLLLLMTIDPKKRWQAVLLWVGTGTALLGLSAQNIFIPNIDFVDNAVWLVAGIVFGMAIGGGGKIVRNQTLEAFEFRRASQLILYILTLIVVVALLEYHMQYPEIIAVTSSEATIDTGVALSSVSITTSDLPVNLVVSALFVVTLRQFVQYDAEESFFVLGPPASGKSLFLIGAYLEALGSTPENGGSTPMNPSQDLMEMVARLDRQEQEWIVQATGRNELNQLEFQYVHGSVFPKNILLESLDYAGEYLQRLPDAIAGSMADDEDMDTTLRRLADGVQSADTLILLLDVERFINNEELEISEYFSILQASKDKKVLLVATKADVLADSFQEERGLEPYRYFEDFQEYVNTRLRKSEQVDALVRELDGSEIKPVYYQTKENEFGDRVPMRDQDGSVMTVGFDNMLTELGR